MPRCSDSRDLAELDPVTFFIVTELMAAERERRKPASADRNDTPLFELPISKVA